MVIGAITAVVWFFVFPTFPVPADSAPSLFAAVVSLSAIAVGFLATAKSILFTIEKRRIVIQIRAVGAFDTLVNYLMTAIHWSFALVIASILCFAVDLKNPAGWHRFALAAWIFILVTSGLACYRVVRIFAKILRSPDSTQN